MATEKVITGVEQANPNAQRAYWCMKDIDRDDAQRLNIANEVYTVLSLLQPIDNITMDIVITIKQN